MTDTPSQPSIDFITWCRTCCTIKDKLSGRDIPFVLNAPQRRVLSILEADRLAGRPIRLILLKARQWGATTLIQAYMAWIQLCVKKNWHSVICAQVIDTSIRIRGMFNKILTNYPEQFWEDGKPPKIKKISDSHNISEITGRGCQITVSSVNNQDSVRGGDFAMAHLTEVAFWPSTRSRNAADVIRAVCGSVPIVPLSVIVLESTANGIGNYFHSEWIRCRSGQGDKQTIFVPWYEIEIYRLDPPDPVAFEASLDDYEKRLRDVFHCDLAQIYWYRRKRSEYTTHAQMMSEFPTTDDEAFISSASAVFSDQAIEKLREQCAIPAVGELSSGSSGSDFVEDTKGKLKVWQPPRPEGEYVAAVDIGGTTERSDFSVIAVLRTDGLVPEVVAQWRGHIHHDILGHIAQDIGRWYNDALLAVESNTLESGSDSLYILNNLADNYPNLYRRKTYDTLTNQVSNRIGFHTNRQTKAMIITGLVAAIRDGTLIERDNDACDEYRTFEQKANGTFGAKDGYHDDILITRAIALQAAKEYHPNLNSINSPKIIPKDLHNPKSNSTFAVY